MFQIKADISTLSEKPLKLVNLGSNIASTEIDINITLVKGWNAIDRLSIIRKSDRSYEIKQDLAVAKWIQHKDIKWKYREKHIGTKQECYILLWTNPRSSTPQNSSCTATYPKSHKPFKWDSQEMQGTAGEARTNSYTIYFYGLLQIAVPVLTDPQRLACSVKEDLPGLMHSLSGKTRAVSTTWSWLWLFGLLYSKYNIFPCERGVG